MSQEYVFQDVKMEFKNNVRNIVLFHIISPAILFVSVLIYFLAPKIPEVNYAIIIVLSIDLISNIYTLFLTYNDIKLDKNSIFIKKGLINKKSYNIPYKKIKGIEKIGLRLASFKSTNAIIPLNGLFYNPERDKFKIYQGYIDDLDFEKFENGLSKKIKNVK